VLLRLNIISSSLISHLISKTPSKLFFEVLLARSNNTHFVKNISQKVLKKSQKFPIISCLILPSMWLIWEKDGLDTSILLMTIYRANHLFNKSQLILSKNTHWHIQVVKYSTYLHISSKNDKNDIVNCDNCPATTHVQSPSTIGRTRDHLGSFFTVKRFLILFDYLSPYY